jgi:hypothetical protein
VKVDLKPLDQLVVADFVTWLFRSGALRLPKKPTLPQPRTTTAFGEKRSVRW